MVPLRTTKGTEPMNTPFSVFDDEVSERLEAVLSEYAVDLETIAGSYSEHIRPATAHEIFAAAARIAKIGMEAGGREMFAEIIADLAAY